MDVVEVIALRIDRDRLRTENAFLAEALRDLLEAAQEAWPERNCVKIARDVLMHVDANNGYIG